MKLKLADFKYHSFPVLLLLLILLLSSPAVFAQYPAGSPVAINGKLKVIGTKLSNECGNTVQLRGMSSHGLQWYGNCATSSSLTELTNNWKIDIFRLAMYVQEGGYVNNPSSWKTQIDNYVDLCGTRGIYCLIDWHVLNPGDPNTNLAESRDFWTYIATKHGSKKHVLYEICNEPNGVNWTTVKNYANDIIPRIRAIDPNTIIIVGTPTWSQDVDIASNDKLNYTNIMYTLHFYSGSHSSALRTKANTALANGAALFVTEFGVSDASGNGGPYLSEGDIWISWMATNNISWCNWSFSDKAESSAALNSGSCSSSNWTNLTQSGTWVKQKLISPADNFNCASTGNQAPTVTITSPANNATFTAPASITINATASDPDGTVSKVDFYNGTTLLGTDASSAYSFVWSNVAAGTYTITAKATDNSGAVTTSSAITVIVNTPANIAPTVSITSPANNATFKAPASITINATAADQDGTVSKVDFYNGPTLLGTDASSVYSFVWSNVAAGTYTITAKATDNSGAVTTSSAITVIVNTPANIAPTVSITSPANNATFTAPASITINATAADQDGTVSKVDFYNGTTLLGTDASSAYSFVWSNVAAGTYAITAKATDNSGAVTTSSAITVIVNTPANIAPTVSITSPANNAIFTAPASITINATAADQDGTVSKVDFYNGNTLLGADATSPFSYSWINIAIGTYIITAKATDNSGAITTSAAITITVVNPTVPQAPYSETATPIPGIVEAEKYDVGGQNVSYNDADAGNSGNQFRTDDVDIEISTDLNGGFNVGWTMAGEWLEYTVNVTASGKYNLNVRVASMSSGKSFHIEMGGTNVTGVINVPNTGGYQTWQTVTIPNINLTAGNNQVMRVYFDTDAINLNYVEVNTVPNEVPAVSITSPANNATFTASANITINATSSDADGTVSKVDFYNGATFLGTDASSPYSYSWTNVPAGAYTLIAKATDNSGAVTTSATISVTVNPAANIAPTVIITSPANNATFIAPANITINATASDADGTVSKVDFYNGATFLGTDASSPYSYSWTNIPASTYTLTAKATDNSGVVTTSAAISVTVNPAANIAPTVSITSPVNNATFIAPAGITINANAVDADGTISKVDFYNGTTLLGTDVSSPYSYSWINVPVGTYTLTAKATDNSGAVTTTAVISVTVNPAANIAPTVSITSPVNNATFIAPAGITINANAGDADGTISKVDFYNGTTLLGTDVSSPYSYSWTNVPVGTYTLTAKATDNSGAVTSSSAVTITVNANQPSVISITSPTQNSTITGTSFTINVNASDPDGSITKVEYLDGTTVIGTSTVQPYSYNWNNPSAGTHFITVRVTDSNGGVTTSSPTTVTVGGAQTGIFSISGTEVSSKIYPNPANNEVHIETSLDLTSASLKILNAFGSEVTVPVTVEGTDASADLGSLASGVYTLLIHQDHFIIRKKIVVTR